MIIYKFSIILFYLVQKVVHPFSEYARSIKSRRTDLTVTGNKGVWVWKKRLGRYTSLEHPDTVDENVLLTRPGSKF